MSSKSKLYHGGKIYTMDNGRRVCDAVLTHGNKIVAVGSFKEVFAQCPADVTMVDLEGATMTPGLIDTHPHLLHWSWTRATHVPLWNCRNHKEIVEVIREVAGRTADGDMILCSPIGEPHWFYDRSYRDLEEGVLPDRHALDQASTRHPIVIVSWAPVRPGVMATNSAGLETLSITPDTPDHVENVWIEKDATGQPTGRLSGSVISYYNYDGFGNQLVAQFAGALGLDKMAPAVMAGIKFYKTLGITTVYENHMLEAEALEVYRGIRQANALKMRVVTSQEAERYGFAWADEPYEEEDFRERLEMAAAALNTKDDRLRFNGITVAWDGYCYGGTQMMRKSYMDVYGKMTNGKRHISLERAEYLMRFCASHSMRLNILSMGLKAHDEVLELLEKLAAEIDIPAQDWVLCHATTIEKDQVQRYKALNFSHTTSMAFGCGEGDLMSRSMGQYVLPHIHPLRDFFDCDMPVGAGTDWGPQSPWAHMQLSLTHEFMQSKHRNLGPRQRISRLEALAMFTSDASKVLRWSEIGSIEPGKLADFAIVDRDPVECNVEDLHKVKVLSTVFDGEPIPNMSLSNVLPSHVAKL